MINSLKMKIENNQVIKKSFFEEYDTDELLDMRDDEEFDSEWMRVYNAINKIELGEDEKKDIDTIREKSFIMAYDLSGSSDVASCISDDFEIICKAYIKEYNDEWLNSLIMTYARGEFPCGELKRTEYKIKDCIDKLVS